MKTYKILIFGHVQNVGYRRFVKNKANELGLIGTVKNLEDGRVEIYVRGDNKLIEKLLFFCEEGSSRANVERVEAIEIDTDSDKRFDDLNEFKVIFD